MMEEMVTVVLSKVVRRHSDYLSQSATPATYGIKRNNGVELEDDIYFLEDADPY